LRALHHAFATMATAYSENEHIKQIGLHVKQIDLLKDKIATMLQAFIISNKNIYV
jgi:hypothetical protein